MTQNYLGICMIMLFITQSVLYVDANDKYVHSNVILHLLKMKTPKDIGFIHSPLRSYQSPPPARQIDPRIPKKQFLTADVHLKKLGVKKKKRGRSIISSRIRCGTPNHIKSTPSQFVTRPTTRSNFEFYYWDYNINMNSKQTNFAIKNNQATLNDLNLSQNPTPMLFHFKIKEIDELNRRSRAQSKNSNLFVLPYISSNNQSKLKYPMTSPLTPQGDIGDSYKNKICSKYLNSLPISLKKNESNRNDEKYENNVSTNQTEFENYTESTTVYDKVKFFEIYDYGTSTTNEINHGLDETNHKIEKYQLKTALNNKSILFFEEISPSKQDHVHDKSKPFKKHVSNDFILNNDLFHPEKNVSTHNSKTSNLRFHKTSQDVKTNKPAIIPNRMAISFNNVVAPWSQYPFSAVYIYEPSKVHCDAAGLSEHWLVAGASCLSRADETPGGPGPTPYVTYCTDKWWQRNRMAYVKQFKIHPFFNHRQDKSKHLYNIGVIQVITSMSTCLGWRPVTLMTHQFAAQPDGSVATALGWGLDRYGTNYTTVDVPKHPLMIYEGVVHSNSCPGSVRYSKAKRRNEAGIKNVYCLSLPPYLSEKIDPVHGGLLLDGTKLFALYLQEERRPWGQQSAQYTGIWHLVPWLIDVTTETEQIDTILDL